MGGTAKDWVLRVVLGRDPEAVESGRTLLNSHPDMLEIEAELARIRADDPGPLTVLTHHLRVVQRRGVRIAAVRPAPIEHSARLEFADRTVVMIHATRPQDLPDLAVRLVRGERVHLTAVAPTPEVVRLELTTEQRQVEVEAIGFDQAD